MRLTRRVRIQLAVFAVISIVAATILAVGYVGLPALFGFQRYTVTIELPTAAGLYPTANVTYRGSTVGKVDSLSIAPDGAVRALVSLQDGVAIPSNLQAQVHSQSAVGEQFVALVPRDDTSRPLAAGDVITLANSTVPPPIDALLDSTNRGLQAIPQGDLKTVIDESYTAVSGLGPELSRLVNGAAKLSIDARANLDSLTTLLDKSAPVLDSQTRTSDSIQAWASHLATITSQLRDNDSSLASGIDNGGPASDTVRSLLERPLSVQVRHRPGLSHPNGLRQQDEHLFEAGVVGHTDLADADEIDQDDRQGGAHPRLVIMH